MSAENKPGDGKREEFRKYLERTGVMDALTKVLVALYEESEKPENALEFIRKKLSTQPNDENIESLKVKLEEASEKIASLEKENEGLRGGTAATAAAAATAADDVIVVDADDAQPQEAQQ